MSEYSAEKHFAPKTYQVTINLMKKDRVIMKVQASSASDAQRQVRQAIFNWQHTPELKNFGGWMMEIYDVRDTK